MSGARKVVRLATLLAAALLSGWCFILPWRHFSGALALYALYGSLLGIGAWLVLELDSWIERRLAAWRPNAVRRVQACIYGLAAGAASLQTAFYTFSGEMISRMPIARVGPYAFMLLVGLSAALATHWLRLAMDKINQGRIALGVAFAVALLLAAAGLVAMDLLLYVALYPHLHTLLEVSAGLAMGAAFTMLLTIVAAKRPASERVIRSFGWIAAAWVVAVVLVRPIRTWLDNTLRHVWLDEVYAARALRRVQTVEAVLTNPLSFRGLSMSRMERLRERFDIKDYRLAPVWSTPLAEPREFGDRIRELRGERRDYDVVVFYVDTLRQDAAYDPAIMPNVARFAKNAITFQNAYATGSDTLRSLPGITGGNYHLNSDHPNDLLAVARRSELKSMLFIAQSAFEFLAKLRPSFKFEQTVPIQDYSPTKTDVWGYGADGPTAGAIVDKALDYMSRHERERKLMWLFNFDQHNWRELDERYVKDAAEKYQVPEAGELNWRYRIVARAIDAEFGRLLDGIEKKGLSSRTIVVFLSDHGEALGRDGFWVHSVFLWECLVRVPLVLRVPGIAPRSVEAPVSLADVAPTLARYLEPEPSLRGYQGEDLLGYLIPDRPQRRLPIVMAGASKDTLVRVGMIDPSGRFKLVISLEAALPELYDLNAPDPDAASVDELHPVHTKKMLRALMGSPVAPRSPKDFEPLLP